MAEDVTFERQPTLQRNAEDRELVSANVDSNFRVESREDRQLMRQRGAGTRQVDAVDFGFHFATPSTIRSRRSGVVTQSPGTAIRKNTEICQTPEPAAGLQLPQSTQSVRSQGVKSEYGGSPFREPSRKRRRLSEISNMTRASSVPLPFLGPSNDLPEVSDLLVHPVQQLILPSSPLFFSTSKPDLEGTVDKENDSSLLSNSSRMSTKRKKRRSIGQQAMRSKKRKTTSMRHLPTPPETQEDNVQDIEASEEIGTQDSANRSQIRQSRWWSVNSQEPDSTILTNVPQSLSGGAVPRLNQSLDDPSLQEDVPTYNDDYSAQEAPSVSEIPLKSIEGDTGVEMSNDEAEDDESSIEDVMEGDILGDDRDPDSRSALSGLEDDNEYLVDRDDIEEHGSESDLLPDNIVLDASVVDNDEEADRDYMPERGAPNRKRKLNSSRLKQPTSRRSRSRSEQPKRQRRPKKPGIPITTYRITNLSALPTINESMNEDESDPDENEFTRAPPAFTSRKSANAIDVLRQACDEAVDVRINELHDSELSNAEIKNCIQALQSFKTAMNVQFFQVSQSLDRRLNLEARVRESRKEKATLQARWLDIRRRRDQLDLEKDEIRMRVWERKIVEGKRFDTSQAAFALERAVSHQEEGEDDADVHAALELRLRTLAKDVSSQAGGGILQNLKSFNAFLESLANSLA